MDIPSSQYKRRIHVKTPPQTEPPQSPEGWYNEQCSVVNDGRVGVPTRTHRRWSLWPGEKQRCDAGHGDATARDDVWGQSAQRHATGQFAEKHRGHIRRGIKGPLALEVVGKGCPGIDGEKDGSFRLALPTDVRNACGSRLAQFLWMGRFNLIEVKAYQLFAAEARREQHIDNSTISPRTPMSLRFVLVLLATPLELMKMIEPITDIFEGTNLLLPQGTWL